MTCKLTKQPGYVVLLTTLVLVVAAATQQSRAASDDDEPTKMDVAKQTLRDGDYEAAIVELEQLHKEDPKDPDVLNLLGYGNRKLGRFDRAREYYLQALAIKPKHKGANEYLGELYLQTGELEKAEERLAVLDKACFFPCSEYSDLKEAIDKHKSDNGIQ